MINTPYIEAEEKACILCDKCMAVCPTEALTVELRDGIDMGLAQIARAACYPWVDPAALRWLRAVRGGLPPPGGVSPNQNAGGAPATPGG